MKTPIVRLVGVEAGYPGKRVLDGVSLEVAPGGFVGIAGPNGAGKTTLLKVILGFLLPNRGKVEVLGASTADPGSVAAIRRRIGYVPQQAAAGRLPMTVFDSVLGGRWGSSFAGLRRPSATDRAMVNDVLDRFGLGPYRGADLRELSGGLRQRVALARAVVREPQLILMDEPTTHLDVESQSTLFALAVEFNRQRSITFVVISHDRELLAGTCSTVLMLEGGRIREWT
ncbi:MAG TPA: ATP-binding cassette domain-containing protein [Firmicutes bacterium]|nr:ATP-binding cassette domain-containing protein [Bacillota bacterium]